MNCQYCGAEIKEGALFCDNCGQAVDTPKDNKQNMDAFWQKENSQKQKDVIEQIAGLKGKCEQLQGAISRGKKLKSRKHFFRIMLVLFLACAGALAFGIYQSYEKMSEPYFALVIASAFTLTAHLVFAGFAILIIKKGPKGLLYPLIPIFGYYYFLYAMLCGFGHLFVPLNKDEAAFVKSLRLKYMDMNILKKEEKELKAGLALIDKGILDTPSLKHLKKTIVTEKNGINGWQITTVIAIIIIAAVFAVSYYFAPMIISSGI